MVYGCEKRMRIVEFFVEGINVCGDEVELRGGDRYDLMWESEVERMLIMMINNVNVFHPLRGIYTMNLVNLENV